MSPDELIGQAVHAADLATWAEGLSDADLRTVLGELHTRETSEVEAEIWAALIFEVANRFLS